MASELIFLVESDETGGFTAKALGEAIFTEAESESALRANVREAVELHFDGRDDLPSVVRLHYVRDEVFAL